MKCNICNCDTDGVEYSYLTYHFANKKYCPSCQYSLELYVAKYYSGIKQVLIDNKRDRLKALSDDAFFNQVTKPLLKGEEVEV